MKKILLFIYPLAVNFAFSQEVIKSDQLPQFPGGNDAMMKYIQSNLKFPESMKRDTTFNWCKAIITFSVDVDGSIKNPAIARECMRCQDCDREALKLIEKMPKWMPGTKEGKAVLMQYALPIFFNRKP